MDDRTQATMMIASKVDNATNSKPITLDGIYLGNIEAWAHALIDLAEEHARCKDYFESRIARLEREVEALTNIAYEIDD